MPDVRGARTEAGIEERHPPGACGKIIAENGRGTDDIGVARMELRPAEKLRHEFPIAAIPSVLSDHVAENPAVMEGAQSQIMRLDAAQPFHSDSSSQSKTSLLEAWPEILADGIMRPDAGWTGVQIGF